MEVFVITNPELGWDCIIGVYTTRRIAMENYLYNMLGEDYSTKNDSEIEEIWNKECHREAIIHSTTLHDK